VNGKRLSVFVVLTLLLVIFLSSSVAAQTTDSGPFGKIYDLAKDFWHTALKFGTFTFLLGDDNQAENLVSLARIIIGAIIGIILYVLLTLAASRFASKAVRGGISILLALLGIIFIPKSLILAIGAAYGTIFAFILLGGLVGGGTWLLIGTPTANRPIALFKLSILLVIFLTVGLLVDFASADAGLAGAQPDLGNFQEWIENLEVWTYLILAGAAVFLIFKVVTGGEDSSVTGADLGDAGSGFLGWFKKKAVSSSPEYKEARSGEAKEAVDTALSEEIVEKQWYEKMREVKRKIEALSVARARIIAIGVRARGTPRVTPDQARTQFESFSKATDSVIKDVKGEANLWLRNKVWQRSLRRTTFKHQKVIKNLLDKLQKENRIPVAQREALRAQENRILENHKKTSDKVKELMALLEMLQQATKAAINARTTPRVSPSSPSPRAAPGFNIPGAMLEFNKFKNSQMTAAQTLATKCVTLQGTGANGVLGILTDILTRVKRL
jgi:hypothetical protein